MNLLPEGFARLGEELDRRGLRSWLWWAWLRPPLIAEAECCLASEGRRGGSLDAEADGVLTDDKSLGLNWGIDLLLLRTLSYVKDILAFKLFLLWDVWLKLLWQLLAESSLFRTASGMAVNSTVRQVQIKFLMSVYWWSMTESQYPKNEFNWPMWGS